jgi:uncharacterized protein (DUF1697 family)
VARYAAFLRAINVGGRRISGADLCLPFIDSGFSEVSSFRASGNVVFSSARKPAESRIEGQLGKALGYEVEVFLRTGAEMRALAGADPFERGPEDKFHVMFLKALPSPAKQRDILALATDSDQLAFGDRELFWHPEGRMTDSELDLKAVEKLIGVNTMRTNGTVKQMFAKYFEPG